MSERICSKCGIAKDTDDFYFNKKRCALFTRCKECCKAASKRSSDHLTEIGWAKERKRLARRAAGIPTRVEIHAKARDTRERKEAQKRKLRAERKLQRSVRGPIEGSPEWYRTAPPAAIAAYRARAATAFRKRYAGKIDYERERTARKKRARPDLVKVWENDRRQRIKAQTVRGFSSYRADRLKAKARLCAYCREPLGSERCLSHLIPCAEGGEHSERNVVVCCRACSDAKADVHAEVWAYRLPAYQCATVLAIYRERYL